MYCLYGEEDIERQKLNVFKINLMGAKVIPVTSGSKTLKDATNEAIRDWVTNVEDTFYIGSLLDLIHTQCLFVIFNL